MKPLWVVFLLATWAVVTGVPLSPSPSQSPSLDCTNGPLGLLGDCLTFAENGSKVSKPEGSCCAGLKTVVKDSVLCLCEAFKAGSGDFAIALNVTKLLTLPSACGISTPSFSKCAVVALSPYPPEFSVSTLKQPSTAPSPAPASVLPGPVTVTFSPSSPSPARPLVSSAPPFPLSLLFLLLCLLATTWSHV
ncbi:hypothetical protein AAC387_Pa08g0065 [Persea americana]